MEQRWRQDVAVRAVKMPIEDISMPLGRKNPQFEADVWFWFAASEAVPAYKRYPAGSGKLLIQCLHDMGLSVACYGQDEDGWESPALDARDWDFNRICSGLAAARCAIGPVGRPIQAAALSGCPIVTWLGRPGNPKQLQAYYDRHWNPHHIRVIFLRVPLPGPMEIAQAAMEVAG